MKTLICIALCLAWAFTTGAYICGGIRADVRMAPQIAEMERQLRVGDADMLNALMMAREVNTNQRDGDER